MAGSAPDHYDVFLSHSGPDKPAVEELAKRLIEKGIKPFLDKWNLIPGDPWQEALEEALIKSTACAVFIGPGGFSPWHNEEMRAAVEHRVSGSRGGYRVIPVVLPGASRPGEEGLPRFLLRTTWVKFSRTLDDGEAFHNLVCGIRGIPPGPGQGKGIFEGECPYRGLEPFGPEHAPFFFGRKAQIDWLLENRLTPMARSGHSQRLLAILGPSGGGKSSLALAGLVPALRAGKVEGSVTWPIALLRPGYDLFENLAFELSKLKDLADSGPALLARTCEYLRARDFADDPRALHIFARYALDGSPAARRLVVLVDQFEEVFTLCPAEREPTRRAFIDTLLHAATVVGGPALVLLTMRADFLGKCASYPALAATLSDGQELVGPMKEDELRLAIERPAYLVGCEVEPSLTERLLHDVAGQPGALPLLQYTLWELWQRCDGRRLTIAAYREIGGVQGALERRADEIVDNLDAAAREVCRRIFLRLTQPGEGTEDTKRRAPFRELLDSASDAQTVEKVIHRLVDARLIATEGRGRSPQEGGGRDQERYVEVAHEALIRSWSRLREWIEADREALVTHRRLTEAANQWNQNGRDESFLYRGVSLAKTEEWSNTHAEDLNSMEREFLTASRALRERIRWERGRNARSRRLALGVMVAVVIAALGFGLWSERQKQKDRALTQIDALLKASPKAAPSIVASLEPFREDVLPRLRQLWNQEDRPDNRAQRMRVGLALLPMDTAVVKDQLYAWMLQTHEPQEMLLLRDALRSHEAGLRETLWKREDEPGTTPEERFRALVALAAFDRDSGRWHQLAGKQAVEQLLSANTLHLGLRAEALRPVRLSLLGPLANVFRDRSQADKQRVAAAILADYAADRPALLAQLITEADAYQYALLWPPLRREGAQAISHLRHVLAEQPRADWHDADQDALARRQANAAVALLRLGQAEPVWPLLRHRPDPSVRSYLIHRLAPLGTDPKLLCRHLEQETDLSVRRALILALGEFSPARIPFAERQALTGRLLQDYRTHPDPGIHGAVDWLLRQRWDLAGALDQIDRELAGQHAGGRLWYVNRQGQTYTLVAGPVEFLMGSPVGEPERDPEEQRHRKRIPRSFALATKAVTVAQFQRFLDDHPEIRPIFSRKFSPHPDGPMPTLTWYEAVAYCRWLSEQEGMPKEEMCYPPIDQIREGMQLPSDYLQRTGYRLPTEAEWEYACRAGAETARFYGRSDELLDRYGWFLSNARNRAWPVGQLKPNDLGVFDAHGNVWNWTQDRSMPYREEDDVEDALRSVSDAHARILRGESFFVLAADVRCAYRFRFRPSGRFYSNGLRPARTYR